jgi:hypothetical protein
MSSTKEIDEVPSNHELPPELRRAWTVHRIEDLQPGLMLNGVVDSKDKDEVIPPYLVRQNLVMPAYPYRAASLPRRINH